MLLDATPNHYMLHFILSETNIFIQEKKKFHDLDELKLQLQQIEKLKVTLLTTGSILSNDRSNILIEQMMTLDHHLKTVKDKQDIFDVYTILNLPDLMKYQITIFPILTTQDENEHNYTFNIIRQVNQSMI